jgi:hypothetical protein
MYLYVALASDIDCSLERLPISCSSFRPTHDTSQQCGPGRSPLQLPHLPRSLQANVRKTLVQKMNPLERIARTKWKGAMPTS